MSETPGHDLSCGWVTGGRPCRRFSTDGTALGADIAHSLGTTDEDEIKRLGALELKFFESDVEREQADWESSE